MRSHRLEGFDCGKPALNDWLLRHARQAQGSGSAKTFVVADDLCATSAARRSTCDAQITDHVTAGTSE